MSLKVVVADIVQRADMIKSFILRHPDGSALPAFKAGAHVNVSVMLASGEKASRAYSLCLPDSSADVYEISVLLQGDVGGSAYMHHQVGVGDVLEISQPVNNFGLISDAETEHVFVAGGIGVTPMLSMARTLSAAGVGSLFHYFGRSAESMAFLQQLRELPHVSLRVHTGLDLDETVAQLGSILLAPAPAIHVYVCGPFGMIQSVIDQADVLGWAAANVHYEQFSSGVVGLHNTSFTVNLMLSGRSLEVRADQTLLDALLEQGVDAYYDCRSGVCGSCMVPMTAGQADHRDTFLSEAEKQENSLICTCVSRAMPGATLELDI